MELSWSTFLLEIINFLVLVWILKHFLYRPVQNFIARRQSDIEDSLNKAQQLNEEARSLKAEYENRLADWSNERQQARDVLAGELESERNLQLKAFQETLTREREKARATDEHRMAEAVRQTQYQSLQQAAEFATRILSQASGPELEQRLTDILLAELKELAPERLSALRSLWGQPPEFIIITSVYPIDPPRRGQLESALSAVTGLGLPVHYEQDADLIAGLRINIGPWVLQVNLRDELRGFAEFAYATQ